ncbi:hypothetical protein [Shewanella mangrovisoli]|uniref:Chemotaxis protein n=1 Tax=Shewanella mangrovisoli TaxID=2864211 RepID=A0ABV4VFA2_9GAMM
MLTPPTDNLYKFMAIFGLIIVFSSAAFWWKSSDEFDQFFDANTDYVNNIFKGGDAYTKFANETNKGIDIYNSVRGDWSKLTEKQKEDLAIIMKESEKLRDDADQIINGNPAKRIALQSRTERYQLAKVVSFIGIAFGSIVSAMGFFLWHTRLQKYIDDLHRNQNV